MNFFKVICVLLFSLNFFSSTGAKKDIPNVVFIMVDDLGIEGFSSYGSLIHTPNVDKLAENNAILFNHCYANPNCTPTRTKLMTGMRNYNSYESFGYLNPKHKTIGNLMHDAGYRTCIAGKWQLNGSRSANTPPSPNDINRPYNAGFDTYQLWSFIETEKYPRYRNAKFFRDGEELTADFGPDAHYNFISDFIRENKDKPFFVYYPMVLVHAPREITPDSKYWDMPKDKRPKSEGIESQIKYVDKIVGKILQTLKDEGVYDNTIIFFTCDNGTGRGTTIETKSGSVRGGKGTLTDAGTHVPLIIHSPRIKKSFVRDDLVDFSDFYPTLADIGGVDVSKEKNLDGISLFPLISGNVDKYKPRKFLFMQFDSRRATRVEWDNEHRNRFARTIEYKLYQTGEFYCVKNDVLEQHPKNLSELTKQEKKVYEKLQNFLDKINRKHPWEEEWIVEKSIN